MDSPVRTPEIENVLYVKKEAIAYVTLNRPKVLNALTQRTWQELRMVFEDVRDDAAIRGVILTGAGDKAFIAGADLSDIAHVSALEAEASSHYGQGVLDLIENLGQPPNSGSPRSSGESSPVVAARSVCHASSARAAPCSSFFQARSSTPRKLIAWGLSTSWCQRKGSWRAPRRF